MGILLGLTAALAGAAGFLGAACAALCGFLGWRFWSQPAAPCPFPAAPAPVPDEWIRLARAVLRSEATAEALAGVAGAPAQELQAWARVMVRFDKSRSKDGRSMEQALLLPP